jgi:hypothetical protein
MASTKAFTTQMVPSLAIKLGRTIGTIDRDKAGWCF